MAQDMIPNTTQTPNVILDEWIKELSGQEFKILMLLVRQTIGWTEDKETGRRKDRDWLNIRQLMKRTGIRSDRTISKAVARLADDLQIIETVTEKGFPLSGPKKREEHNGKIYYRLTLKRPKSKNCE